MKYIGFVVLIIVLFASLFKVYGAELTNNVAAVALMVLLLSLFSDLKEFNFWGLTGTRDLKENLQKLQGKPAVTDQSFPRVPKAQMQTIKMETQEVEMTGDAKLDFMLLIHTVEVLLVSIASTISKDVTSWQSKRITEVGSYLFNRGILTRDGLEKIEQIDTLRRSILYGDTQSITSSLVKTGIKVAEELSDELQRKIEKPA